jgi:hypothetical protein
MSTTYIATTLSPSRRISCASPVMSCKASGARLEPGPARAGRWAAASADSAVCGRGGRAPADTEWRYSGHY